MNLQALNGKTLILWGLGREGWSLLQAIARRRIVPHLRLVLDSPLSPAEKEKLSEFEKTTGLRIFLFPANEIEAAYEGADVLVKSPGVSLYRPEILLAKRLGLFITSTTSIWSAERDRGLIIAVSGTKGKSTTSLLISKLLESTGASVRLGGNIGTPLLDVLDCAPEDTPGPDYWVIELSSYQLADADIAPDIGVLLNLYPEHVDWHGSIERYYSDKLRLIDLLGVNSILLKNGTDERLRVAPSARGKVLEFNNPSGIHSENGAFFRGPQKLFSAAGVKLYGAHNLSNICAALSVYEILGFDAASASSVVEAFSGLPHRLSFVGEKNSVTYINDSISTVPQSAVAAFRAFPSRWITAILGGLERAQNWDELAEGIALNGVRLVITLPDCGPKIAQALRHRIQSRSEDVAVVEVENLQQAVETAANQTPTGGVVLLSPAAPSYGHFRNFEERGNRFQELVKMLPG